MGATPSITTAVNTFIESDWRTVREALVDDYGEDSAHHALYKLLAVTAQGRAIREPLAWCRVAAKYHLGREYKRNLRFIPIAEPVSTDGEEDGTPEWLRCHVTPERVAIARETLRQLPLALLENIVAGTPVSRKIRWYQKKKHT